MESQGQAGKARQPIERLVPKAEEAIAAIASVMRDGHVCAVAASFGKDSSCLVELALAAAIRVKAEGGKPRLISMSGDTLVENPEMARHMRQEIGKLKAYASHHGLDLEAHVVTPSLRDTFQVSVLGGRAIPSFAGQQAACSVDWKVGPMSRLIKKVTKRGSGEKEVVILTGTRFDESEARGKKMRERGESHLKPIRNPHGNLVLSPLATWETDDVWEVLGYCASGMVDGYSDHRDTIEIYAAAGGTSCAVVADMVSEGKKASSGCGARTGCWSCLQVSDDKSMAAMVEDDRFSYMAGLGRLRNYLAATQNDWSKRHWVGRPIEDGFIRIGPYTYSGREALAIARYCMTLDAMEAERAREMGVEPRFEIISFEQMVAIDCLWSMEALQPAFTAVKEWVEIRERGTHRYKVPEVVSQPARPMPSYRFLHVGAEWDQTPDAQWAGLEDCLTKSMKDLGGQGCMGTVDLSSGRQVMDVETAPSLEVNLESAVLAVDFEFDHMMSKRGECLRGASWTSGYRWWLQRGAVMVSTASRAKLDGVLRRTVFKERMGLAGEIDVSAIIARTVSAGERDRMLQKDEFEGQAVLEFA